MKQKRVATTATRLKEAMKLSGKKQADLVKLTGLNKASVSNYIHDKYDPKSRALRKLAIALDVSEMWLWGYDVPRERTTTHKKNDRMVAVIEKMRKNEDLLELIEMLSQLSPEQYDSIKQLLAAFAYK